MVFFWFGNSQQMQFGNDSSWPINLDLWVIMIQSSCVLLFSYILLLFCFFSSIIIGLTSQLVDADARGNTNAQTQTRKYISNHHQTSISDPFWKNCYAKYHFCVSLKICFRKYLLPLTKTKTTIFWHHGINRRKDTLWWHGLDLRRSTSC